MTEARHHHSLAGPPPASLICLDSISNFLHGASIVSCTRNRSGTDNKVGISVWVGRSWREISDERHQSAENSQPDMLSKLTCLGTKHSTVRHSGDNLPQSTNHSATDLDT